MRYVIQEERDDIEQRCLEPGCDYVNSAYDEPRRWCPRGHGGLGAFRAYGTERERAQRLAHLESGLRDWAL